MATKYKIRVQAIATADDDGKNAASILATTVASRLTTVNQIFAPAEIEFVFDPEIDFLTINSTLLNRDFTLLELPNVGDKKWDHEPLIDSESHSQARDRLGKQFPDKLVIIFRNRKQIDEERDGNNHETGFWIVADKGGGGSSAGAPYVNMSTSSRARDLAHEMGHYLQLPHTHIGKVKTISQAASKIKKYVENGNPKSEGLDALDGDSSVLLDTLPDCAGSIFGDDTLKTPLDKCSDVVNIPVTFEDNSTRTYVLNPDRSLVMSYFKGCPGDKTITPQQARRVRDGLELRHRHELISFKPLLVHRIKRAGTETGSEISEIDTALVRAGRLVTAVRDSNGNLKVIVWDIENSGANIIRRGSGTGGAIGKIAICGLGANMVATAVQMSSGELRIITWRIEENGDINRLGEVTAAGQITDVAACITRYKGDANQIATAVRQADGTLKVDVWQTFVKGTISHIATATAGKINLPQLGLNTPRLAITNVGVQSLVTYIRDEAKDLKTILWKFDAGVTRLSSIALDAPSIGNIAACSLARELTVAAIQDKDEKLKLIAYTCPEDGRFIEQRGTAAAGSINKVEICPVGTGMVVTGVRIAPNKLKLIMWHVTKTGDHIIRLDDDDTGEVFDRMSMCYTDQRQWATALRDGNGKLKIIVWRVVSVGDFQEDEDLPDVGVTAPIVTKLQESMNLARGGECDIED